HIYKYSKCNREWSGCPAGCCIQLARDKDQRDETDNNDVTCHHVREKTNDQREGLNEHAQELHRHQDQFHPKRYTRWIENMSPIMRIRAKQDNHKGNHTKHTCKSNITRNVG